MKLTVRTRNIPPSEAFDLFIENCLFALAAKRPLHEATVLVERRDEGSPAYRAVLDVAVPGPDVHSEQIDHSPVQAFTRAFAVVEEKLNERTQKREKRLRQRQQRTAGARLALGGVR